MREKIIGTICLVLGIIVIVSTGTSFAYFSANVNNTGDDISGSSVDFDVDLLVEETYRAEQLIPLEDNLILKAVNNNCRDYRGYQVCALYKITLTNNGEPQILNAYVEASEGTNYITDHLKGQLFSDDLKNKVSNVLTLTDTDNTELESRRYFYIDDINLYSTEINNSNVLYLALWLTETGTYQDDDYNKEYYGNITFESINGSKIFAEFSA